MVSSRLLRTDLKVEGLDSLDLPQEFISAAIAQGVERGFLET